MAKRKEEMYGYFYPRFAIIPRLINNKWLWFEKYYTKTILNLDGKDTVINIDEEEYVFKKLAGTLVPELLRAHRIRKV